MKKKLLSLLLTLVLFAALLPGAVQTAWAKDYDHILSYQVDVTPNVEDGSLAIRLDFRWEALEDLPAANSQQGGVKIGIPNGSIRELTALTDNIADLQNDSKYVYVDFTREQKANKPFDFSFSWVQEYMYTLDGSTVSYSYTPGWFDSILIDEMTLTWHDPAGVTGSASGGTTENGAHVLTATNMGHGAKLPLSVTYSHWPVTLDASRSADNLPGSSDEFDPSNSGVFATIVGFIATLVILFVIFSIFFGGSHYSGGFGTRYVFVNGLWYPRGPGGKPRPGSVGTKHRPEPPRSSDNHRDGGFGGGGRGGGFGGGGFSGGSHCACASSCACACACACAGGGRAGCSAKNLYGAIHLDKDSSEKLR